MNATSPIPVAPETIVYRQQLALHTLPKHPRLSTHYANRLRKLHPTLPPLTSLSCPKCENVSLHGRGSIRVGRQAIIKECYVCGAINSVPRPESRARGTFQSVRIARMKSNFGRQVPTTDRAVEKTIIQPLMPVEPLAAAVHQEPLPPTIIQPNNPLDARTVPKTSGSSSRRQKSKNGLQSMLQRNREREAREAQNKNANSSNLSLFLQGL
ncbi:unnamed protein product [Rhizoctonia solani]|uniref:Uncharacterized protein n=1 Tax=Rhizoctonia solani TaxID=456999 RepID=A0A8H3I188_9AGAM|nr:unnamed protein product [Rhizoctonia solani]